MATHYGFFDSVNSDRKYSAEDFNRYLSGLISDGIFENYGECFRCSVNGDTLTIGSGKAWINGHFFENDSAYTKDLSSHRKANSDTTLAVRICCDTEARTCGFVFQEIPLQYTSDSETKRHIGIANVTVRSSSSNLSHFVGDARDVNDDGNGYVRCVLTKCGIGDFIKKLDDFNELVKKVNNRLDTVEIFTGISQVEIIKRGTCGANLTYYLRSDGVLHISGSGDMKDYDAGSDKSPFFADSRIKNVIVENGVTSIGNYAFYRCGNLETVEIHASLHKIGEYAFALHYSQMYGDYGIRSINLPASLMSIGRGAFMYTMLNNILVPSRVSMAGSTYNADVFYKCNCLQIVNYNGQGIGNSMFAGCTSLVSLNISKDCKRIETDAFDDCPNLHIITYSGTANDWRNILIGNSKLLSCNDWMGTNSPADIIEIRCSDVKLVPDTSGTGWNTERYK